MNFEIQKMKIKNSSLASDLVSWKQIHLKSSKLSFFPVSLLQSMFAADMEFFPSGSVRSL